jgi:hypothetical protein
LKFQGEVWAGWACAAANEKELTTCAKSGGHGEKKIQEKWVHPDGLRRRPAARGRRLSLSSGIQFFEFKNFKKKIEFLEVREIGQGFWETGCTVPPIFEACPYTWKC